MPGIHDAVTCFLLTVHLDVNNMTRWLAVASSNQMPAVVDRCLRIAEGPGVLHSLFKCAVLCPPSVSATAVAVPVLRLLRSMSIVSIESTLICHGLLRLAAMMHTGCMASSG